MDRLDTYLPQLIRNAIRTPDGTLLVSEHRHDFKEYTDRNGKSYMIDGGLSYIRMSCNGDEERLFMYDNEPHEVQRWILKWGTYGRKGDGPLRKVPIADMSSDHIEAVLEGCCPAQVYKACMEKELDRRGYDTKMRTKKV